MKTRSRREAIPGLRATANFGPRATGSTSRRVPGMGMCPRGSNAKAFHP
jgi:hypothetical protein